MVSVLDTEKYESPNSLLTSGKGWRLPDQLAEPSKPKPLTSKYLDSQEHDVATNGLYFQKALEAQQPMSGPQWHAPSNDVSIPRTDQEDRAVVRCLVHAIKNMSEAKDTAASPYRRRFSQPKPYYANWAIEACAWDVVAVVKGIHMEGFTSRLYDAALIDAIGETQNWHFEDRIGWICLALRTSKNVAVNLMKKEKIMTIVGAPHKLHKATIVNYNSNANRAIWVQNGRDIDREHQLRPFKKRTDHDGVPLPLPKRLKRDDDDSEGTTDDSPKKASNDREASDSPSEQWSPSPDRRAANGTSPRPSRTAVAAVSGFSSASQPINSNFATCHPPVPADSIYLPMTSYSLDAINRRINHQRQISKDQINVSAEIKPEAGSSKTRSSIQNDRNNADSSGISVRSNTKLATHDSGHGAAGTFNADVNNATTGIAAAVSTPLPSAGINKTEDNVEMHDAADIDAAHVLASLQRGPGP
ncbi:hypothetical protein T440DRAFT_392401 [Plenodomus tracheiphilus IPT5]|uniref:Uncharacterized protein n=1 Tax=Plenodomus tracheiphilus IPT5 TaxID=1408161 RepID=A0A6A7BCS7_9PLEO|nr:hypothetical protein T440DRAFT_392401 [Plenodomus tracheiphilus IPT5]